MSQYNPPIFLGSNYALDVCEIGRLLLDEACSLLTGIHGERE